MANDLFFQKSQMVTGSTPIFLIIVLGSRSFNIHEPAILRYHPGAKTLPILSRASWDIVAMEDLDPGLQGYSVAWQRGTTKMVVN